MNALLSLSRGIDELNERVGKAMTWLILIVVVISAGNAVVRYAMDWSSNALLEIQWYLFSAVFLLSAGYVLKRNEHIRIDIVTGRMGPRVHNWIDVFGILVFLLPMALMTMALSWPVFTLAWTSNEMSANPGGLVRWPVRLLMPVGFFLLTLQGIAELIKRIAFLTGAAKNPLEKEKTKSAEEELAEEILKHQGAPETVRAADAAKQMLGNGDQGGRQ